MPSAVVPSPLGRAWEGQVGIFPNPTNNTLNIQLTSQPSTLTTQLTYSIQNTIGQTLLTTAINDQQMTIDISNLPNGIYIFTLHEGNKIVKYENWLSSKKNGLGLRNARQRQYFTEDRIISYYSLLKSTISTKT